MISELPVLSCDNCGACCETQCSPPGYVLLLTNPHLRVSWPEPMDVYRLGSLPEPARISLIERAALIAGGRFHDAVPCCWLDTETKKCKWYEHRPQSCREFEIGSAACREWRDEFKP